MTTLRLTKEAKDRLKTGEPQFFTSEDFEPCPDDFTVAIRQAQLMAKTKPLLLLIPSRYDGQTGVWRNELDNESTLIQDDPSKRPTNCS